MRPDNSDSGGRGFESRQPYHVRRSLFRSASPVCVSAGKAPHPQSPSSFPNRRTHGGPPVWVIRGCLLLVFLGGCKPTASRCAARSIRRRRHARSAGQVVGSNPVSRTISSVHNGFGLWTLEVFCFISFPVCLLPAESSLLICAHFYSVI